ncbi:unnamed protein product [Urochloa humidicola]
MFAGMGMGNFYPRGDGDGGVTPDGEFPVAIPRRDAHPVVGDDVSMAGGGRKVAGSGVAAVWLDGSPGLAGGGGGRNRGREGRRKNGGRPRGPIWAGKEGRKGGRGRRVQGPGTDFRGKEGEGRQAGMGKSGRGWAIGRPRAGRDRDGVSWVGMRIGPKGEMAGLLRGFKFFLLFERP